MNKKNYTLMYFFITYFFILSVKLTVLLSIWMELKKEIFEKVKIQKLKNQQKHFQV